MSIVAVAVLGSAGKVLRVCSPRFAVPGELDKVAIIISSTLAQQRALVSILKLVAPGLSPQELKRHSTCKPTQVVQPVVLRQSGFDVRWYINCTMKPYVVQALSFKIDIRATPDSTLQGSLPTLNEALVYPILLLRDGLEQLEVLVYGGNAPVQLGSLSKVWFLSVFHFCMTGGLPPNLLLGLPDLKELRIGEFAGAEQYQPDGALCGITGPVPPEWYTPTTDAAGNDVTPGAALQSVELSDNKLSGSLPDILGWRQLQLLFLANNEFSGGVSGHCFVAACTELSATHTTHTVLQNTMMVSL
jgi:hypothetical protein